MERIRSRILPKLHKWVCVCVERDRDRDEYIPQLSSKRTLLDGGLKLQFYKG